MVTENTHTDGVFNGAVGTVIRMVTKRERRLNGTYAEVVGIRAQMDTTGVEVNAAARRFINSHTDPALIKRRNVPFRWTLSGATAQSLLHSSVARTSPRIACTSPSRARGGHSLWDGP